MMNMNLPSLSVLYLRKILLLTTENNLLASVGPITNARLQSLEFLNLSENMLTNVNLADLNIANLKRLSLADNKMHTIQCRSPTIFRELEYLNLCKI